MPRTTILLAALAGTLAVTACSINAPQAATTPNAPLSLPGIEPLSPSAVQKGTDVKVSLQGSTFATQYVSGDIEEILIGLYDTNPGNPVDPDREKQFAFSLGGWVKTDNNPAQSFRGVEYPWAFFDDVRYLCGQDIDEPTKMKLQNGRYMIRHLTKAGSGFTSPTVAQHVTFYNIPDGNYRLFAIAVKNGAIIGRDVQTFDFNASHRKFYAGNSGASYVDPTRVPELCLVLDPNPDVKTTTNIHDSDETPHFGE